MTESGSSSIAAISSSSDCARGRVRVAQAVDQRILDRLVQEAFEKRDCSQPGLVAAIVAARHRAQRRDNLLTRQVARDLAEATTQLGIGRIQQRQEVLKRSRTVRGNGLCLLLDVVRVA